MRINSISFKANFPTRQIANFVSGKETADSTFLSKISGVPEDTLLTHYDSDVLEAGSHYCATKITERHPEFNILKNFANHIRQEMKPDIMGNVDASNIRTLCNLRDLNIQYLCSVMDKDIKIDPIDVPFFKI